MTKVWTRIAIGAAVVSGVALATYFWMPARMAAASFMSGSMMNGRMASMMETHMKDGKMPAMMESHMKGGDMAAMMEHHGKDGNMAAMMEHHGKDGNMAAMMESHMKDGNMAAMMEMMGGDMAEMMAMMGDDMMANMDKLHEAMAPMHQKEVEAAAKVLGISAEDLTKALAEGKSADSLAKERSVDPALITSALVEVRTAAFAGMVSAGTLTQEQAGKMLEHMNKAGSATLGAAAMMQGESCHDHMAPKN